MSPPLLSFTLFLYSSLSFNNLSRFVFSPRLIRALAFLICACLCRQ
nr:MAG TPA: hypothetical protein [Caudoviricetes sp.]